MAGRTLRKSPERIETLCKHLAAGATRRAACAASDISPKTLERWQKDDVLGAAIKKADGLAEALATSYVVAAMPTNWQAAAWWLERRRAADYGRKQENVITVKKIEDMTLEEMEFVFGDSKE